ncbi:MAG: DNA-directed RNA polymerase subunit beta [Clostridiales bacterium GWF2_36_10]|nr:MAG: DNA-directed RNA polymerase subunit beta [Clostridiales bacterium GWF2_36_10]
MLKEQHLGKVVRMSFSKNEEVLEMPNLIEVQKKSFRDLIEKDIKEVLADISPMTDYSGNLVIEFIDYSLSDTPKYAVEECKERDVNYATPFKVIVRLTNKVTGEVKEQEIYMGDFPTMTDSGTFIINGAERVIVSQIVRSPGIYYSTSDDKTGKHLISATVIPYRGAWLEYETDSSDVFYVRIDKNRKIPITVLLRAFGLTNNEDIINKFGEELLIKATFEKDITVAEAEKSISEGNMSNPTDEALKEIYRKLRPGDPPIVESAQILLNNLFFDPKRYDISPVGRYKFNKKLAISKRIIGQTLARPAVNPFTGEILFDAGYKLTRVDAEAIERAGVCEVYVKNSTDGKEIKVFSNKMVDAGEICGFSNEALGLNEYVSFDPLIDIINKVGLSDVNELKNAILLRRNELIPNHISVDDVFASVNYMICLSYGIGKTDDIDHLSNRRLRSVGELLYNQLRIGFSRMDKIVKEKMTTQDIDTVTPQSLINIRPIVSAIRDFFGSSPLSQFMDQTNPLSELTHKRRLSALGPGGLSRDRASFEVRDIHYTHYGRMCPIETPEGPNIGLISYLATYARVNSFGFIEAPYRVVKNGVVTKDVIYLTADSEDEYICATANEELDENGRFVNRKVVARHRDEVMEFESSKIDLMDVSAKMVVSVATAMIPFLENDDNTRALMGSNMQKQAVPLMISQSPIVATGMEYKAAYDSGVLVICRNSGIVESVSSSEVVVNTDKGRNEIYKLIKFKRSNQGTCINQRPVVVKGQRIEKGDVVADGPATDNGEVALGKNVLIGFMTWEGYNYEDAILINERLVREDVYTSIHIEEYYCESRDTKLGAEEITRDIPNVGDDVLRDLDSDGVIRIGAEVRAGDILVGKVTPKGETELTAEERLLRAIFGEKAREVRDTSLKLPHGESGIVVDVKVFSRDDCDVLQPGVIKVVRVYIAQKRKISVGDKMAGRHGNKGVISRILPSEDMPFMPDGTPLDIVLNPLGVPSRMNIGQVLEVHLGIAASKLGWKVMTPVFDGANERDIQDCLVKAGISPDGKTTLYDGRTGIAFDSPVTVGYMYFLKLHHLVDDKIHARSTGPYSLVTQQPLGGKAQFGGQRFGEMEVWALYAYGAAYTLQEILTVKSDDIKGRVKTYEAIVKGQNIPTPGVPASFKVLVKELQSLGLDVRVRDKDDKEITLKDYSEDESEDEKKFSESELGANVIEHPEEMLHDDEEGVIADDADEDEEVFDDEVYEYSDTVDDISIDE